MLTVMKQVPGNPTFRLIAGCPHTFSFYVYIWQKGMTEYWSDSWGHEGWEMTSGSQLIQQSQLEYLSNYKLLIPHNLAQYNYSEALQTFLEAFPLSISFDNSSHWIPPNLWSYPAACIAIYHQHILVSKYCGMNTFLLLHGKQKHKQQCIFNFKRTTNGWYLKSYFIILSFCMKWFALCSDWSVTWDAGSWLAGAGDMISDDVRMFPINLVSVNPSVSGDWASLQPQILPSYQARVEQN